MENLQDVDMTVWHSDKFIDFLNRNYGQACLWCGEVAGNRWVFPPRDEGNAVFSPIVPFAEIQQEHSLERENFYPSRLMDAGLPMLLLICKKCGHVYSFALSEVLQRYKDES